MHMEASPSSYYEATNALTKIQLALQMLDRQAPLATAEHQLVTLALRAATDLTRILSDTTDQVADETEPTKTQ